MLSCLRPQTHINHAIFIQVGHFLTSPSTNNLITNLRFVVVYVHGRGAPLEPWRMRVACNYEVTRGQTNSIFNKRMRAHPQMKTSMLFCNN